MVRIPGNPDHPLPTYCPDDRGTTVLCIVVIVPFNAGAYPLTAGKVETSLVFVFGNTKM